ncbi:MAG: SPOR domain-containing protein [Comamonas sp.]|nr:SPOR domain-containing protein [Comamonas sp.]
MLRFTLLVLLLANGGYFAWSHGWMASLGWMPQVQSEPHRLQQQVRPDVVRLVEASSPVVAPPESALPATPPPTPESVLVAPDDALTQVARAEPAICLQAGSFDEEQSKRVEQAVRRLSLPSGSWEMVPTQIAGRWMVYVGKFANEVALEKRRAELRNRKIAYDRAGGQLEPGLSLGRFSTEEAATRELTSMLQQGVRGARVVQERAASTLYTLRLPQVTTAQRSVLQALEPVLLEKPLRRCIE